MEAREAIRKRKCVKKYLNKPVSFKILYEVLDCSRWAQTALGAQSWEFIIVRDGPTKVKLSGAADQSWIADAPAVVIMASNLERIEFALKREPQEFAMMEISAAVQNMQVAARSMGIGTCAVFLFDRDIVKSIIKAPKKVVPLAMVPIGYPKEFPENSRAPLSEFLHEKEFSRAPEEEIPSKYNKKWQRSSILHIFS
ncbi:MAG: hypothetical protein GOU98_00355 [Candidatus Altiarchaeota archaeon]|nr:hypothetical protein [Candidatus Altiarchaeota archaeon]